MLTARLPPSCRALPSCFAKKVTRMSQTGRDQDAIATNKKPSPLCASIRIAGEDCPRLSRDRLRPRTGSLAAATVQEWSGAPVRSASLLLTACHAPGRSGNPNRSSCSPYYRCDRHLHFARETGFGTPAAERGASIRIKLPVTRALDNIYRRNVSPLVKVQTD